MKAFNGEIDTLISVNSEYRPPENPDLVLDTETLTPDQSVDYLNRSG